MSREQIRVSVREAHRSDYESWAILRNQLWPSLSKDEHLQELIDLEGEYYKGWIASYEDQDIGFIESSVRPFANGCDHRPVVFLEGIWVHLMHQDKGVGHSLLLNLEKWATENGYKEIGSDTELENLKSQKAHIKWGFQETERVVYYRKKL